MVVVLGAIVAVEAVVVPIVVAVVIAIVVVVVVAALPDIVVQHGLDLHCSRG
jgi:hypothetical protein